MGRESVLRWDRGIGEVEFGVGKLDGGRWRVWEAVRGGGWGLGTVYLSERDRKPFAVLSHSRPADTRDVDPARVLEVTVLGDDPDALIRYHGPDGVETADTIPAADVRAFLDYQSRKRTDLESRRGANGSPRRPWGFRKGWLAAQTTLAAATVRRGDGRPMR